MSSNSFCDDTKVCCAKCGARKSSTVKLSKCSRCLCVKYCSRECQSFDWKRHKRVECNAKTGKLPPGISNKIALDISDEDVAATTFRAVLLGEPKNVLCCCWCCGMLLKVCGERGLNPTNDSGGPFWTETYGRILAEAEGKGKTFPAVCLLGKPGSTGYMTGVNKFGQAAACIRCSLALICEDGKHADKHIRKCEEYLYDDNFRCAKQKLPALSVLEKRMIARIAIKQEPNLSDGLLSIGGYMNKEGNKRKIKIPYNYRKFEHLAFPHLLCDAAEFDGNTLLDLYQYTVMRLYSADKSWREDCDYVAFSILRLAAYGLSDARNLLQQLPTPLSLGTNLRRDQFREVRFVSGFH